MKIEIMRSGDTRPPIFNLPKRGTSGGSPLKDCALVMKIIRPKKMLMLASVMMKECTPERTTAVPLMKPRPAPNRIDIGTARKSGTPEACAK